jgi:hypothetical protein
VEKLFKIPLVFLFIASCIGLLLRYQIISPVEGIVYSNFLHAHSHVMFLGWVCNVLLIAFTTEFHAVQKFKVIFWFLQFCILGMLVSFPLQGYGAFSITFSTLHIVGVVVFVVLFFRASKTKRTTSLILARSALLFFMLSSLGPFFLGYLKANSLDHTDLYRFSIYFYLHFQYNGFFLLGILSLLVKLFEEQMPNQHFQKIAWGSYILIGCCIPAYFLSILWAQPSMIFNLIGFLAALLQIIGLSFFIAPTQYFFRNSKFAQTERLLFLISFSALALKSILQLISTIPAAAVFADEYRSIVIAYLHLMLVGCISFFLIAWLIRRCVIDKGFFWAVALILTGFTFSEIMLVMLPWNSAKFRMPVDIFNSVLFLFSTFMVFGIGRILYATIPTEH